MIKRIEGIEKRNMTSPVEKPVLPLKFKDAHQNGTTVNHIRHDTNGKTVKRPGLHYGNPSEMYESTYNEKNVPYDPKGKVSDGKGESKPKGHGCCYAHDA